MGIDPKLLSQIKKLCKQSDEYVQCAFDQLWHHLKDKKSSQVRFYALLVSNELFKRSSKFRSLLCNLFQEFISNVVTGNEENLNNTQKRNRKKKSDTLTCASNLLKVCELPPPAKFANLLRNKALYCIEEWQENYGAIYKPLQLGYRYLKDVLRMKFPNIRQQREQELKLQQEREEAAKKLALLKYDRMKSEYIQYIGLLRACLNEMDICFKIIVPDFVDIFEQNSEASREQVETSNSLQSNSTVLTAENSNSSNSDAAVKESNDDDDEWEQVIMTTDSVSNLDDEELHRSINLNEDNNLLYSIGDEYDSIDDFILGTGLGSSDYEITIESSVSNLKNTDNDAAYEIIKERLPELRNKWKPMVLDWLSILTTLQFPEGTSQEKKQLYEQILRSVVETKEQIEQYLQRCQYLEIKSRENKGMHSIWAVPQLDIRDLCLKRKRPNQSGSNLSKYKRQKSL